MNEQPKVERYTDVKVDSINLFNLYTNLNFQTCHIVKLDGEIREPLKVHQFQRLDNRQLFYFPPIRDLQNDYARNLCTLTEALIAYRLLFQQKIIQPTDITVMSLCLVQDRAHFNTIMICGEKVYIIEPRSNNITSPMLSSRAGFFKAPISSYPIKENVIDPLRAMLVTETHTPYIYNIFIGVQSIWDDTSCGKHQVNFTELISNIEINNLNDISKLQNTLKDFKPKNQNDRDYYISYGMRLFEKFVKQNDLYENIDPKNPVSVSTTYPSLQDNTAENIIKAGLRDFITEYKILLSTKKFAEITPTLNRIFSQYLQPNSRGHSILFLSLDPSGSTASSSTVIDDFEFISPSTTVSSSAIAAAAAASTSLVTPMPNNFTQDSSSSVALGGGNRIGKFL